MSILNLNHIRNEHSDWLRALDFYKLELAVLRGRLTEIAGRNLDGKAPAEIEHFQNQFMIQSTNIDELRHNIRDHIKEMQQHEDDDKEYLNNGLANAHHSLREDFLTEEKLVNELRHEFTIFAEECR
jgi:hypothetical protein